MGEKIESKNGSDREKFESTFKNSDSDSGPRTAKESRRPFTTSSTIREGNSEPETKGRSRRTTRTETEETESRKARNRFADRKSDQSESDTIRLGNETVNVPKPSQKAVEEEADGMAEMIVMAINTIAVSWAGSPEAQMNELEKLFIQGPLSQWLAVPSVYNKVAKNMTPVMCVMGLAIYGIRVNMVHQTVKSTERAKNDASERMRQEATTQFQAEPEYNKEGRVNPDLFENGTNDPSIQHEFLNGEYDPTANAPRFTTELYQG